MASNSKGRRIEAIVGVVRKALRRIAGMAREASGRIATPGLRRRTRRAASALASACGGAAVIVLRGAAVLDRGLTAILRAIGRPASALVERADRLLTPARGAVAVAVGGYAILAFAQFRDYRGIAIGQAQYEGVAPLTSAPMAETWTPWSTHGPTVALLGAVALVATLSGIAARRRRDHRRPGPDRRRGVVAPRRANRSIGIGAVASSAALGLVLAVGLSQAGRVGEIGDQYANVQGVLLDGFYMQLAGASALLGAALLPLTWRLAEPEGDA